MTPRSLHGIAAATGAVDEVVHAHGLDGEAPPPADLAVNLHGRGPESTALLARGDPDAVWAFSGPTSPAGPAWWPGEHEVRRWCRLVAFHGVPAEPCDLRVRFADAPGDGGGRRTVSVVHPGAASGGRRWPPDRFAAVARRLRHAGHRVVVTGSADEVALARRVAGTAGLPADSMLAGRTSALDLAHVVASARLVVCGDTGVAHLAVATGAPSVALFGPTSPAEWGPPPSPRHRVLWAGTTGDPHAEDADPGLLGIGVDEVMEAIGGCLGP